MLLESTVRFKSLCASPKFSPQNEKTREINFLACRAPPHAQIDGTKVEGAAEAYVNHPSTFSFDIRPKQMTKRATNAKFIHPDTVLDVDASDNENSGNTTSSRDKDVSDQTYTLTRRVMLGPVAVVEDTDFPKLGEFSYRQFETMAIRKLDKWVNDPKIEFEWVSGKAVVSTKAVKVADHLPIVVEDETGWEKVEAAVRRWMLENKSNIIVKLTVEYKKKGQEVVELSDDDKSKKVRKFEVQVPLM